MDIEGLGYSRGKCKLEALQTCGILVFFVPIFFVLINCFVFDIIIRFSAGKLTKFNENVITNVSSKTIYLLLYRKWVLLMKRNATK